MKFTLLYILLMFSFVSFGQKKYRTVKNKLNLIHKEVYQIEKKNKIKDGFYYIIKNNTKDTLVIGNYKDDKKVGIWKYYGKGKIPYMVYDFSKNELLSNRSRIIYDSTYIKKEDKYILDKVDNPQIPIGFKDQAQYDLAKSFTVPKKVIKNGTPAVFTYSFVISKDGVLKDIKVEQSIDKAYDEKVIKTIKELNYTWIPAKKDGKAFDSKSFIIVEFSNGPNLSKKDLTKAYLWCIQMVYYSVTSKSIAS